MEDNEKSKGRLKRFVKLFAIIGTVSFLILVGLYFYGRVSYDSTPIEEESTEALTTITAGDYIVSEISGRDAARNMLDMESYFGIYQENYDSFLEGVEAVLESYGNGLLSIAHAPTGVIAVYRDYDLFQSSEYLSTTLQSIKNDLLSLCELYNWNVCVRFQDGETQVVDIEIYEGTAIFIPYLQTATLTFSTTENVYYGSTIYTCMDDDLYAAYNEQTGLWGLFFDTLKNINLGLRVECRYDGYAYMYLTFTPFECSVLDALTSEANAEYLLTELQRYYIQRGLMSNDVMGSLITE